MLLSRPRYLEAQVKRLIHHVELASFDRKRLFITGGTGFFGLWLLTALSVLRGESVEIEATVLSRNPASFLDRFPHWGQLSWLNFVKGDVKDFSLPTKNYDYVIHAATDTSREAHADPLAIFSDVVVGTQKVLRYAVECGVQRVLCASSGAVYGQQPAEVDQIPDDASYACATSDSASAYGESKRVMEFMAATYAEKFNFQSVSARCFAFIGAGLPIDQHFAIGNFIRDALFRDYIEVKGDGTAVRSYLYGADLAIWLLTLLVSGRNSTTYNVGSDQYLTMQQIAETVRNIIAPEKEIRIMNHPNLRNNQRSIYVPSIERARHLGLQVWTELEDAVRYSAEYLQIS